MNWRQKRKDWRVLDDVRLTVTRCPHGKAERAGTDLVMNLIGGVLTVNSLLTHQQHWELITAMPQFDPLRLNIQLCYTTTFFNSVKMSFVGRDTKYVILNSDVK